MKQGTKKVVKPAAPAPKPTLWTGIVDLATVDPAKLAVVSYPAPVLKKRAKTITAFDAHLRAIVERMKMLMEQSKGVGLAAPQVGLSVRLFVASETGKAADARAFINPEILEESGQEEGEEGCLSLSDIRVKVTRFTKLKVRAVDEHGTPFEQELASYPARIIQHENDHLDGILLLDRMSMVAKMANRRQIKALEERAAGK